MDIKDTECYRCGVEDGKLIERDMWEHGASEMLVKYGNDISDCFPNVIAQVQKETIDKCIKLIGGNIKSVVTSKEPLHTMEHNDLIESLVEQLSHMKDDLVETW